MHLIIDVGNTFRKIAVFQGAELLVKEICDKTSFTKACIEILEKFPSITQGIVSSVGSFSISEIEKLTQIPFISLDQNTPVPFINKYATPHTLGVDRIALVSAAAVLFPRRNTVIIDAGSCITLDFLSQNNEYFGGTITPGLAMRYEAMHHFTENLPLLSPQIPESIIGDSTQNAMHLGAFQGVVYEIEGAIAAYQKQYPDLLIILTGGDTHLLRDSLKNDIFANSNFLLEGLNFILQHNTDR